MKRTTITIIALLMMCSVGLADTFIIVRASGPQEPDQMIAYPAGFFGQDSLTGRIIPPKYVQFQITDFDDYESLKKAYMAFWYPDLEWTVLNNNYDIDGFRIKAENTNMSASGMNALTRDKIENFLNKWGATIVSVDTNQVVFDATVFGAIESEGFWGVDIGNAVFTETAYNSDTGLHEIEVNYSATGWNEDQVVMRIEEKGGAVVSTPTNKVNFTVTRLTIFNEFKKSVKEAVEGVQFSGCTYRILDTAVQAALDAGGTLQVTKNQAVTYFRSRLDD